MPFNVPLAGRAACTLEMVQTSASDDEVVFVAAFTEAARAAMAVLRTDWRIIATKIEGTEMKKTNEC